METVNYGHVNFEPNTYFVQATHHDARLGRVAEGFADPETARERARTLAADEAYQDVVLITEVQREAIVSVFKGVQWFCEGELRAKYGDRWRVSAEAPPSQALPFATPAPAPDARRTGVA